ncbi:MAG: hypothetical protein A2140_01470 [Candidatus Muproteobacteria bacterium RBG_16_62_13]|uniref:Uncharacterized protein n=1 Tax=Candidatus Muproteobacteria bacterium RBG_16_62_13 TaxID=1817756 RepID=A0A1F6T4L7_9PROT|nr:MAG: hypothetical protein A2140_01470 [Candidatus Muproteobacteria bacterium RBG_16_62_13]
MQTSHNLMWLLIAVFFIVLLAMVFNAWRKHNDALGKKLRGLRRPDQQSFDANTERNRARAQFKGETLTRTIEEIDLKAQLTSVANENYEHYRKSQRNALKMMIGVGTVLAAGALYGFYRFIAGP